MGRDGKESKRRGPNSKSEDGQQTSSKWQSGVSDWTARAAGRGKK